jgi:paired amphipathic helix protein Sin3a
MKKLGEDMSRQANLRAVNGDHPAGRANPIALELGLQDPSTGPAAVVGVAATSAAANNATNGHAADEPLSGITLHPSRYYDTLLDLVEKFFDGELDSNTFEESVRFMYGIEGYLIFTIDTVVGALIKAAQVIMTDSKSQELQSILENDKGRQYKDHIARRMKAESIVGKDENLYRVEWIPLIAASSDDDEQSLNGSLLMQLLSRDDLTLDAEFESGTAQDQWLYYISSYTLWTPTEGLTREATGPFLDRSLKVRREIGDDSGTSYRTRNGLEIKVCISTYRLFFGQETEDYFARLLTKKAYQRQSRKMKSIDKKRVTKFNDWLTAKQAAGDEAKALVDETTEKEAEKAADGATEE